MRQKSNSLLLFLLLLQPVFLHAQTLTPGIGYADIAIGMDVAAVYPILGQPTEISTREAYGKELEDVGYNIQKDEIYEMDFDSVVCFPKNDRQIFNVYTKEGKIAFFSVTRYGYDQSVIDRIDVLGQIHFLDSVKSIKKFMGKGKKIGPDEKGYTSYLYSKEGILYMCEEDVVTVFFIFAKKLQ